MCVTAYKTKYGKLWVKSWKRSSVQILPVQFSFYSLPFVALWINFRTRDHHLFYPFVWWWKLMNRTQFVLKDHMMTHNCFYFIDWNRCDSCSHCSNDLHDVWSVVQEQKVCHCSSITHSTAVSNIVATVWPCTQRKTFYCGLQFTAQLAQLYRTTNQRLDITTVEPPEEETRRSRKWTVVCISERVGCLVHGAVVCLYIHLKVGWTPRR